MEQTNRHRTRQTQLTNMLAEIFISCNVGGQQIAQHYCLVSAQQCVCPRQHACYRPRCVTRDGLNAAGAAIAASIVHHQQPSIYWSTMYLPPYNIHACSRVEYCTAVNQRESVRCTCTWSSMIIVISETSFDGHSIALMLIAIKL